MPSLYRSADLPAYFCEAEGVPLLGGPLLLDAEVGAVDCHETIVQLVVDKTALEIDLWFHERATTMQGGDEYNFCGRTTSKKHLPLRLLDR